ncbi:MAG TPA: aminodeoxychorismate synthase component I [Dongiaceae bacterium]|nr:aminodeoxychorismate synthase component I [Dongiaceae bacterium]
MPPLSRLILPYPEDSKALFARLRHLNGSFLLLSCPGFADARFDVMSALPERQVKLSWSATSKPADLQALIDSMIGWLEPFRCDPVEHPLPGWFGLASYDLYGALQGVDLPTPSLPLDPLQTGFYPSLVVVDHQARQCQLLALPGHEAHTEELVDALLHQTWTQQAAPFQLTAPFKSNLSQSAYLQRFHRVRDYLLAGDCYQVNLAQRFSAPFGGDPWDAFHRLTEVLAAPMASYFKAPGFQCLSLSPERFLSIRNRRVVTRPIKGTRPRDPDPSRDQANAQDLQNSEKDRAENLMIVDLLRNDLGRCCQPGSIKVTDLFAVESYANVHHLVSTIEGNLHPDVHPLQAFFSAFPGGSITGAPKRRAIEIIAELEPDNRSFYCGSAFYCDVGGNLDSSILIRSLVAHAGQIHCWGGGGIVADSVGDQEYQETLDKVGIILRTLAVEPS